MCGRECEVDCSGGKYIYSSTMLKYSFKVLFLTISILSYFILLLHYAEHGSIVLFTPTYMYMTTFRFKLYTANL